MTYNSDIHNRKSIRLKNYDYSQAGFYFITICTQNHDHLFGKINDNKIFLNDAGLMVEIQWNELIKRFKNIKLHEYTIMPNHFHGIINMLSKCRCELFGSKSDTEIGDIIQAFKSITTHQYICGVKQNNWQRFDKKLWQRNYWEHIIRTENELNCISQYIIDNPKNWENDKLNNGVGNLVMERQAQYNVQEWMV